MASYFVEILGELLFTDPVDKSLKDLPSPEFLKNKILIKAKKVKLTAAGSIDTEMEPDDYQDVPKYVHEVATNSRPNSLKKNSLKGSQRSTSSKRYSKNLETVKTSIFTKSKALSDLVNYTEAVKFAGFEQQRQFKTQ